MKEKLEDKLFRSQGPELLVDLADHVANSAKEVLINVDEATAQHLGQEVAVKMSQIWGGQIVYFPAGTVLKSAQTHIKIFEAFNGRNQNEVAAKFGISVQHVYNIVKRMRKEVLKDIQGDMFTDSGDKK